MEMHIQNIKVELIQWLTTLNDELIIQKLIDIRNSQILDGREKLLEAEIKSIEKGIQDADKGKLVSHSDARKVYEKYL